MHPIYHNRNQHNTSVHLPLYHHIVPLCHHAIVPSNLPSRHRAIKTLCHQAIFPLSHVPSQCTITLYHHIVPMSLCAIVPLSHVPHAIVPLNLPSSIVSSCHVPSCHCIVPLCHQAFVPSSHCIIVQSYHCIIVP